MLVCELVRKGEKRTASSTECMGLVMAFAKGRCTLRCCKILAIRSIVAVVAGDAPGRIGRTHRGSGCLNKCWISICEFY